MDFVIDTGSASEEEETRESTPEKNILPLLQNNTETDLHNLLEESEILNTNLEDEEPTEPSPEKDILLLQNSRKTEIDELLEKSKLLNANLKGKKLAKGVLKKNLLPLRQNSKKTEIDKLLEKSEILNTNFEEPTFCIEPPLSKRKLKKLRKEEKEKTKGDKWFGLPATELTEEVKRDLELMQMRSVLDPKHFYKKNHMKVLPKYFQVGKVEDTPLDFYNNRLTKKDRKKTLVEELMSDAEFHQYNKSKYAEILKEKKKTEYRVWKQSKRLNKKKK